MDQRRNHKRCINNFYLNDNENSTYQKVVWCYKSADLTDMMILNVYVRREERYNNLYNARKR